MKTLDNLLKTSNYEDAKEYALKMAKEDNNYISLLIQYLSWQKNLDNWEDDEIKDGIAEALGQIGDLAIPYLTKLYRNAKDNLSAKFYAAYAFADYSLSQSGQISDEIRHILLDALSHDRTEIRTIVSSIARIPHHVENIRPWIKHLYLEQQDGSLLDNIIEDAERYFKEITEEEIKKIEELLLSATEEEMIGISIALVAIPHKNMTYLMEPLSLKVKNEEIKALLLDVLRYQKHWVPMRH